jgi:hypothetical protein
VVKSDRASFDSNLDARGRGKILVEEWSGLERFSAMES